jgi:hypothetical protein
MAAIILLILAVVSWRSLLVHAQNRTLTADRLTLLSPCNGTFPCWLTLAGATVFDPNIPTDPNVIEGNQYYKTIDAFANVPTLAAFQITNQFTLSNGQPRNVGFQAFYFNNGDLQLGREMHCNQQVQRFACYVSNYGPKPFPAGTPDNGQVYPSPSQALSELEQVAFSTIVAGPVPFATVAMESLPDPPDPKTVSVTEADGITANLTPPKFCAANYNGNQPPTNKDVDTGVDVESGDLLTFSPVAGYIWLGYCFYGVEGPEGMGSVLGNPDYPLDTAPEGALIGRIGASGGSYFAIGNGVDTVLNPIIYSGRPGRLFLRTNDNNPGNGSGSFNVTIRIQRNKVRFYIYQPTKDSSGNLSADPQLARLIPSAALDKEGNKSFPQMCMACHGGSYDTHHHEANFSSFLPFDVFSFLYSQKAGLTLQDQEEQFRQLNVLVKNTNPNPMNQNRPIQAMVDTLYGQKAETPGTAAITNALPAGWTAHPALYNEFVTHYCRTCHLAQGPVYDYASYDGFSHVGSGSAVCGTEIMPHAQVPFTVLSSARISSAAANDLNALGYSCLAEFFRPVRLIPLKLPGH